MYTPEEGLPAWQDLRWETETWDPYEDSTAAGQYLIKASNHRPSAPVEVLAHHEQMNPQIPGLTGDGVRLTFVGDVMWLGDSWDNFALPVAGLLDGDLRVGNLETPTDPDQSQDIDELGLFTFNAPPAILDGLALDLLQLNNNHSVDVGDDGLEATLAEVESRGFEHTGVDAHARLAVGDLTISFLSYTWGINGKPPSERHELFVVPFGHLDEVVDLSSVEADIQRERSAGADVVVVMPHWGFEYEYYADPHFLQMGRRMVMAGADLVVGQGPHVVQPAELCHVNEADIEPAVGVCSVQSGGNSRTALLLPSLGNFSTIQPTVEVQTGIVATVEVGPEGVLGAGWEAVSTITGGDGHEVHALTDLVSSSTEHAGELGRLRAHLGGHWERSTP
ncbi:MAG: CapA family protein [Deltaproteobacteria bacterium]|nr:CapA family protein [Deltaproteobacteria bacterium]